MSCLHPILVKRSHRIPYQKDVYIQVPCGKCPKCLARLQSQWSLRMEMESFDPSNKYMAFITLTYDNQHVPPELDRSHFPEFIDRLRTNCKRKYGHFIRVRYFCCGEYGDKFGRPHIHAIIYSDYRVEESDVSKAWNMGIVDVRPFSFARCGYVAKYSLKQLKGAYGDLEPPFHLCSLGLGKYFIQRYGSYVYKNRLHSWFNLSGREVELPRYYIDKIYPRGSCGRASLKVHAKIYFNESETLAKSKFCGSSFYAANYRNNDTYNRMMSNFNFNKFISKNYV